MEDNVKSFLDKIQELTDKKTKVYVASTKKSIDCQNLSFKQQKELISTLGDGVVRALKFQKILTSIIVDNTGNSELLITDKLPIILQLRANSIGGVVKRDEIEIQLSSLINKAKALVCPTEHTVMGDVTVHLKVPTIGSEIKVIQSAIESIKKEESEFGKNIGNIYTYEIVKYVDSIDFGSDTLNVSTIPIKDRYKIVENLPLSINKDIIAFIQGIKVKETEVLTYDIDKVLDIDVSFFDS